MFLSTEEIKVLRTRSLEFHCPTLVPPSYGPDGKQSGAQVASVPVTAPQNAISQRSKFAVRRGGLMMGT